MSDAGARRRGHPGCGAPRRPKPGPGAGSTPRSSIPTPASGWKRPWAARTRPRRRRRRRGWRRGWPRRRRWCASGASTTSRSRWRTRGAFDMSVAPTTPRPTASRPMAPQGTRPGRRGRWMALRSSHFRFRRRLSFPFWKPLCDV